MMIVWQCVDFNRGGVEKVTIALIIIKDFPSTQFLLNSFFTFVNWCMVFALGDNEEKSAV